MVSWIDLRRDSAWGIEHNEPPKSEHIVIDMGRSMSSKAFDKTAKEPSTKMTQMTPYH